MKPWEETWRVVKLPSCDEWEVESDHVGMLEMSDPAHVALASAAPDMARVLLAVEWCGRVDYVGDGGYRCCPACEGISPDEADCQDAHEDIARGRNVLGHKPACELVIALRKAGGR